MITRIIQPAVGIPGVDSSCAKRSDYVPCKFLYYIVLVSVCIEGCISVRVLVRYAHGMVCIMGYEVFKRTGARVETPTLSITPDGRIVPNAAAARVLKGAGARHVLLLWDRANHRLALKAAQRTNKNAFSVSLAPDGRSGGVRARSLLRYIGWNAPQRETLSAIWNEGEKMLEIELPLRCINPKKGGVGKQKTEAGAASDL